MNSYTRSYDSITGKLIGVFRDGGAFVPADLDNKDWTLFLAINNADPQPLDLSDVAPTAPPTPEEELARKRVAAITSLLTRGDETGLAVRIMFEAVIFLFNNRLEALGQPRLLQPEIFEYIQSNPNLGDPR